jgi:ribosomal protein L22
MEEENKQKTEMKEEQKKTEEKASAPEKKETKKEEKKEVVKKEMVTAKAFSARVSHKYSFAICKMIRGKTPERAIEMLENVIKKKQPVKMPQREVAHQKGKGIAGAKFPLNAAKAFIPLVVQLNANAHALGVENPVISIAMANKAAKVYRKGGKEAKRTHIVLEAVSKNKFTKNKK